MRKLSLQNRLLVTATIILPVFLGLTGLALDQAFQNSAEAAEEGRLQGELYGLLGAAELSRQDGLVMTGDLAEPLFSQPQSGLVGQIINQQGELVWQSPSALGIALPALAKLEIDESRFQRGLVNDLPWFSYSYGVAWVDENDGEHRYTFRVMESPRIYDQKLTQFRQTLIVWLGAATLLLLILQVFVLRWSLAPLRRIEDELQEVEKGDREQLTEDYPRELNGLAAGLNLLLANERRHLQRYRNSLADLAHSMKTPLAVLRGLAESKQSAAGSSQVIEHEVSRMDNIVEYQLQKAAASGRASLGAGISIKPVVKRLLTSLRKVYRDKSIAYQEDIDEAAIFRGEEGDLMEVIGNLLDNASKWCRAKVSINVAQTLAATGKHGGLIVTVEDDGPGIAGEQAEHLLQRGIRGDTQTPGHGIGLAVVREIVEAYGGSLTIARSTMGGAKMVVEFPG